jgi:tetratricopeptide (TPR) repeat protein
MNQNVMTVLLAVACGVGGGIVGARFRAASTAEVAAVSTGVGPAPEVAARMADVDRRQATIEDRLEEIQLALADLSSAQRTAAASRTTDAVAPATAPSGNEATPKSAAPDARSAMDRLLAGDVGWDEAQKLWKEVADAGKLDELVGMLEERAQARGNDPEAQTQLGLAYLQKVFRAGAGPEAGTWATKADRAFDAALAVDDQHWQARFQKAVSLSFWPPMMGKQPGAVKQFETLVAQQEASGSPQPGYAKTYLFLGNMHLQMGDKAKALAAWNKGLAQFPTDAELLKQVAGVQ